ncbi:uncharacterized protein LAJ45_01854 [Morchella importuna]|uniref:uncharacterized protein n=1 Tax=Morchella importuna TaxID=1174673 RepID=UPI001E8DF2CC|nr:uncharacterized protein LAJ45_01854 [Morchella importuna]KAH8154087.1 hypothetical protein LAJ45_01854 [Morchella importuna]
MSGHVFFFFHLPFLPFSLSPFLHFSISPNSSSLSSHRPTTTSLHLPGSLKIPSPGPRASTPPHLFGGAAALTELTD